MELELFLYAVALVVVGLVALCALLRLYALEDTLAHLRSSIKSAAERERLAKTYSCAACYRTGQHRKITSGQEGDR